jgi:hypothetical protein
MRVSDRDLIRGGHYGQRSCEPHPIGRTHGCTDQRRYVEILLDNPEPSTHGTKLTFRLTLDSRGDKASPMLCGTSATEDVWQNRGVTTKQQA